MQRRKANSIVGKLGASKSTVPSDCPPSRPGADTLSSRLKYLHFLLRPRYPPEPPPVSISRADQSNTSTNQHILCSASTPTEVHHVQLHLASESC